jgi:hypothetical protein
MNRSQFVGLFIIAVVSGGCGVAPSSSEAGTGLPQSTTAALEETAPPDTLDAAPTANIHCTETDPHPIAQSIAETYGASYDEVMSFFCTGVAFEDIVLAYQTAELVEIEVKEALTLWYDFGSWDAVWEELGID